MSSVLHPVGPEPEQTYWVRRALVVASAVLLVALVIALVVGSTSTGSAVSADPSPPPVAPAEVTPTPSPWETPTPTPSGSASPSATSTAAADASASPSASSDASASPTAKKSASPSPKPTKAAPVTCSPKDLRATLTGKQQLKPKQGTTFRLSLINGSDETCRVEVDADAFELKVYSGTDRIWSSDDCAKAVKTISKKVRSEDAVEWTMRWDGRRSRPGCKDRPEVPQAGTYFATAQLDGAEPVQLRMILRG